MRKKKVEPRDTPSRDERYMGLAWMHAGFSKDPSTQVGAQIVSAGNRPLGSGYNGPPRRVDDRAFSWERPAPDADPEALNKYDIIVHAEVNALDHSDCAPEVLVDSTLYVTALPCPACMKEIVRKGVGRVVYMDYQSGPQSSLQNAKWREKSFRWAKLGHVKLEKYRGDLRWLGEWADRLREIGVIPRRTQ